MENGIDLMNGDQICIKTLLIGNKADRKCTCNLCTGKRKPGRPKEPEFKELLHNAVKGGEPSE